MRAELRVGVIGDFDPSNETHRATNAALRHAADLLGEAVSVQWVATPELASSPAASALERYHGLWCAPASPYRSMIGALNGIRFAREQSRPFVGT